MRKKLLTQNKIYGGSLVIVILLIIALSVFMFFKRSEERKYFNVDESYIVLDSKIIRAGSDGYIDEVYIEEGDIVKPNQQLFSIVGIDLKNKEGLNNSGLPITIDSNNSVPKLIVKSAFEGRVEKVIQSTNTFVSRQDEILRIQQGEPYIKSYINIDRDITKLTGKGQKVIVNVGGKEYEAEVNTFYIDENSADRKYIVESYFTNDVPENSAFIPVEVKIYKGDKVAEELDKVETRFKSALQSVYVKAQNK